MKIPKFIDIDGKPFLWRDLLQRRREQLAACKTPAQQPALFALRDDPRPAIEHKATERYLQPSLFTCKLMQSQ